MYAKGIAVVAITRRGVETALKIKEALDNAGLTSKVYAPKKYNQNGVIPLEKKFADFIKETYSTVDALVAVMATGITIRAVAPLLENKLTDPAVVGVDAAGKFVSQPAVGALWRRKRVSQNNRKWHRRNSRNHHGIRCHGQTKR